MRTPFVVGCFLLASLCSAQEPASDDLHVISSRIWHLGNDPTPEWKEAPVEAEGFMVSVSFEARAIPGESILFLKQRDVHNTWLLALNGKPIAALTKCGDEMGEYRYSIPPGVMVDGENTLTLVGQTPTDDILFGDIRYSEKSTREYFNLRQFALHVSHEVAGVQESVPARITIVDSKGELADMFYASFPHVALRPGILYTSTGHAVAELPVGDYVVYASRGMEWSRAKVNLHLAGERPQTFIQTVELKLVHEVDTPGFVAADTHIHTLTHSGHGDSSVEERQITLAGEGVELAIATDHNHNIDYRPTQKRMGLSAYYTPVVGNEVTTPIGHFNAFPLNSKDSVPLYDSSDLKALLASMRSKGARTVILNHPRWPEGDKAPFNTIGLDSRTGFWKGPWASGYDAMELVNSDTEEKDPLQLYRDWFSLMNKGDKVVSVGSSDSHAVGVVVGQGRTYVRSKVSDVSRLDINECSDNIARGHSSVSMGMFADLTHGGKSVMGRLLGVDEGNRLPRDLALRFAAPSWVDSQRFMIFVNGQQVLSADLKRSGGENFLDAHIPLGTGLDLPDHDYWLVAVALGAKVTEPFWPLRNDYTLASTNPIFVDVDGDGKFSCAREIAEQLLAKSGTEETAVLELLAEVDGAVAAQVMRLVRLEYDRQARKRIQDLNDAALRVKATLEYWIK